MDDDGRDAAAATSEATENPANGAQHAAVPMEPQSLPPKPRRKRKLLRKSRALEPGTGETGMPV